jgi:hypothetical protein
MKRTRAKDDEPAGAGPKAAKKGSAAGPGRSRSEKQTNSLKEGLFVTPTLEQKYTPVHVVACIGVRAVKDDGGKLFLGCDMLKVSTIFDCVKSIWRCNNCTGIIKALCFVRDFFLPCVVHNLHDPFCAPRRPYFPGEVPAEKAKFGRCLVCAKAANHLSRIRAMLTLPGEVKQGLSYEGPIALQPGARTLPLSVTLLRRDTIRDVVEILQKTTLASEAEASLLRTFEYVSLAGLFEDLNPVPIDKSGGQALYFCPGIIEEEAQVLGNSSVALGKHTGTLRHVDCTRYKIQLVRETNIALCEYCRLLGKSIVRSSEADRTQVVKVESCVGIKYLNTPEREKKQKNTAMQVHSKNKQIIYLQAAVERLKASLNTYTSSHTEEAGSEESGADVQCIFRRAVDVKEQSESKKELRRILLRSFEVQIVV